MQPNISGYQSVIRAALTENGWEIASAEELDAWWCHESWQLRSLRSPLGFRAVLTFLIDPQSETERLQRGEYRVWAVKASQGAPAGWQDTECEFTLPLSGKWRQLVPKLIGHLSKWRDDRSNKLLFCFRMRWRRERSSSAMLLQRRAMRVCSGLAECLI